MNIHYYLRRQWVRGEYECWAFICDYYKRELGIELPLFNIGVHAPQAAIEAIAANRNKAPFVPIEKPELHCVVEFGKFRTRHVGIYLEGDMILHCIRGAGGLCQPIKTIQQNILGFNRCQLLPTSKAH